ncbi:MAG: hypothetical protein ACI8PZ_001759 [Myxococcota bacterium]|jgi:hypothetical protein
MEGAVAALDDRLEAEGKITFATPRAWYIKRGVTLLLAWPEHLSVFGSSSILSLHSRQLM